MTDPVTSSPAVQGLVKSLRATHLYSWNVFRYAGDFLHLFGIIVLLLTLYKNRSCAGVSLKTNVVYVVLFLCRYLDLFMLTQRAYLVIFKSTFIIVTGMTVALFYRWHNTYESWKDTVNVVVIFLACFLAALLFTSEYRTMEILWTYSQFLEAFALVPQYVFSYRDNNPDKGIFLFILCLGSYRVCYAMNWIYKKANEPRYSDMQSWIGGVLEIMFFIDYLINYFRGKSLLKSFAIKVDDKIRNISDTVELRVLGTSSETRDGLRKRAKGTYQSVGIPSGFDEEAQWDADDLSI